MALRATANTLSLIRPGLIEDVIVTKFKAFWVAISLIYYYNLKFTLILKSQILRVSPNRHCLATKHFRVGSKQRSYLVYKQTLFSHKHFRIGEIVLDMLWDATKYGSITRQSRIEKGSCANSTEPSDNVKKKNNNKKMFSFVFFNLV